MMKKMVATILALAVLLAVALPLASAETVLYVQGKTADRVHLRAAGSSSAKSLGLYFNGTVVKRLSQGSNGWDLVQIGAVTGYMHKDYLSAGNTASAAPTYVVNNTGSTWVNVRSAPSTSASVNTTCSNDAYVTLLGETSDGWSYVRVGNQLGYIMTQFLKPYQGSSYGNFNTATELNTWTTIVGQAMGDGYIHRYIADNGQDIYFTSVSETPRIMKHDVNFDSWDDLVVYTSEGSSCLFCQFYVFQDGTYYLVTDHGFAVNLCNYVLHPEKNMVSTHANNGYAGALFEDEIYRWDGTQLHLLRRAESDTVTQTWQSGTEQSNSTTYYNLLQVEVRDYTRSEYGGEVIWQRTNIPLDDFSDPLYTEIERAMWQGL